MATKTIPQLPAASALAAGDLFDVSQGGVEKKATLAQVATGVSAAYPSILLESGLSEPISAMPDGIAQANPADMIPFVSPGQSPKNVTMTIVELVNLVLDYANNYNPINQPITIACIGGVGGFSISDDTDGDYISASSGELYIKSGGNTYFNGGSVQFESGVKTQEGNVFYAHTVAGNLVWTTSP